MTTPEKIAIVVLSVLTLLSAVAFFWTYYRATARASRGLGESNALVIPTSIMAGVFGLFAGPFALALMSHGLALLLGMLTALSALLGAGFAGQKLAWNRYGKQGTAQPAAVIGWPPTRFPPQRYSSPSGSRRMLIWMRRAAGRSVPGLIPHLMRSALLACAGWARRPRTADRAAVVQAREVPAQAHE